MFKKITAAFFFITGLLTSMAVLAQNSVPEDKVQMADGLRANGKIYVVVAVLATILTGILLYVFRLDRKISKLEKQ